MNATTMQYAVANAQRKVSAQGEVIAKAAQHSSLAKKLYTTEEIATELGLSNSWVYATISRDKPEIAAMHGKRHLYSATYLETLRARGAKPRHRRVQVLNPVHRKVEQVKNVATTIAEIANSEVPLFQRLALMEMDIHKTEQMLEQILHFLGLKSGQAM